MGQQSAVQQDAVQSGHSFVLQWAGEPQGQPVPLEDLLTFNADDEILCAWLRAASVGNEYRTGGAEAECVVRRVA